MCTGSHSLFSCRVTKETPKAAPRRGIKRMPPGITLYFCRPVNRPAKPVHLKFEVKSEEGQTAEQYFDQAEEKLRLGFKEEALDLYLKAVDKDPQLPKGLDEPG